MRYYIYYKKKGKTNHAAYIGYPSQQSAMKQFHERHPRTKILTVKKRI